MENTAKKSAAKTQTVANKSMNKIAKTAKNINTQVSDTVEDVMTDVKTSGKEISALATKTVKEAAKKVDAKDRMDTVKKAVKNANDYTLETAEELVDGMFANGEKWQNVAAKAVKSGLKIAEKQQDLMFSTLEAVKGQFGTSANRLRNIFKSN